MRMGVGRLAGLMAIAVAGALAVTMGAADVRAGEYLAQILAGGDQPVAISATIQAQGDASRQEQDKNKKDEKKDDKEGRQERQRSCR